MMVCNDKARTATHIQKVSNARLLALAGNDPLRVWWTTPASKTNQPRTRYIYCLDRYKTSLFSFYCAQPPTMCYHPISQQKRNAWRNDAKADYHVKRRWRALYTSQPTQSTRRRRRRRRIEKKKRWTKNKILIILLTTSRVAKATMMKSSLFFLLVGTDESLGRGPINSLTIYGWHRWMRRNDLIQLTTSVWQREFKPILIDNRNRNQKKDSKVFENAIVEHRESRGNKRVNRRGDFVVWRTTWTTLEGALQVFSAQLAQPSMWYK